MFNVNADDLQIVVSVKSTLVAISLLYKTKLSMWCHYNCLYFNIKKK